MNEFVANEWKRALLSLDSSAKLKESDPDSAEVRESAFGAAVSGLNY